MNDRIGRRSQGRRPRTESGLFAARRFRGKSLVLLTVSPRGEAAFELQTALGMERGRVEAGFRGAAVALPELSPASAPAMSTAIFIAASIVPGVTSRRGGPKSGGDTPDRATRRGRRGYSAGPRHAARTPRVLCRGHNGVCPQHHGHNRGGATGAVPSVSAGDVNCDFYCRLHRGRSGDRPPEGRCGDGPRRWGGSRRPSVRRADRGRDPRRQYDVPPARRRPAAAPAPLTTAPCNAHSITRLRSPAQRDSAQRLIFTCP